MGIDQKKFVRIREWLHTVTMLQGSDLTQVAKLEYESGIDVEKVADGLKLVCDDGGCVIHSHFESYGRDFFEEFVLNPAADRFRMLNGWHDFSDHSKSRLLRYVMTKAMRGAPRESVIAQQKSHLKEAIENTKQNLKKHGFFQDAFEAILNAERKRMNR